MEIRNNKIYFLPKKNMKSFIILKLKKKRKGKKKQQIEEKIDFTDYMND